MRVREFSEVQEIPVGLLADSSLSLTYVDINLLVTIHLSYPSLTRTNQHGK